MPSYLPLKLVKISGALVLLFSFLSVGFVTLIVEIAFSRKFSKEYKATADNSLSLYLHVGNEYSFEKRRRIFVKYVQLCDKVQSHR
jgi:hypothetical protein